MALPELRPYQKTTVTDCRNSLKTHKSVVLSTCPSGGKTIMALSIAQDYLDRGEIVMVLTHGTTVLLDQWNEEIREKGIEHENLITTLPQSIRKIKEMMHGKELGLLIVDEAHEFYFAEKLVQTILKTLKPKHELLLTGTPSKFILDNIKGADRPIHITSGVEVYGEGFLQDTYFGMVKSSYDLRGQGEEEIDEADMNGEDEEGEDDISGDYNLHGDLKRKVKLSTEDTTTSLDDLIDAMIDRLKGVLGSTSINAVNFTSKVKLNKVNALFGELKKTMIAAHSIKQGRDIRDILTAKGVCCILSESEGDVENENIGKFIKDESIKVLIVVRRGILGFNMPSLCNVVDFTCSRNINRIYQLYARVLRKHPDGHNKFFFRLTSKANPAVDSFYLQAALSLNNKDFISKFNGKNLSHMEILVPKRYRMRDRSDEGKRKGKKPFKQTPDVTVDVLMYEEIMSLKLMQEMTLNSGSEKWNEFEYAKMGEVIRKLTGKVFSDPEANKKAIIEWILAHGVEVPDEEVTV